MPAPGRKRVKYIVLYHIRIPLRPLRLSGESLPFPLHIQNDLGHAQDAVGV